MNRADAQGDVAERTCLQVKGQGEFLEKYKAQKKGGAVLQLGKTDPQPAQHHEGAEFCMCAHTHTPLLQFLLGKQRLRKLIGLKVLR